MATAIPNAPGALMSGLLLFPGPVRRVDDKASIHHAVHKGGPLISGEFLATGSMRDCGYP